MERNEQTTAAALAVGDRFYKQNDRSRRVFQIVASPVYVSTKSKRQVYCVNAALVDKKMSADRLKFYAVPIANTTPVIFLRTSNEKVN